MDTRYIFRAVGKEVHIRILLELQGQVADVDPSVCVVVFLIESWAAEARRRRVGEVAEDD